MKTNKQLTVMAIVAIVTLAFAHCKDDPPAPTAPADATINAFDRSITITFPVGLSQTDADTIKEKLQTAMTIVESNINAPSIIAKFHTMLDREGFKIVIENGTAYDGLKKIGNNMAFHKDWLLLSTIETIHYDIGNKVAAQNMFESPPGA